jgi:hypothetical protein
LKSVAKVGKPIFESNFLDIVEDALMMRPDGD